MLTVKVDTQSLIVYNLIKLCINSQKHNSPTNISGTIIIRRLSIYTPICVCGRTMFSNPFSYILFREQITAE